MCLVNRFHYSTLHSAQGSTWGAQGYLGQVQVQGQGQVQVQGQVQGQVHGQAQGQVNVTVMVKIK